MKIFYGVENNYVEITGQVLEKCLKNNEIYIPSNDNLRAVMFGDPLYGVLKNIKIEFDDNLCKIYYHNNPLYLKIIDVKIEEINNITRRKTWWKNVGKNIKNPEEKVMEMHKYININYGNIKDELSEQIMATTYISEDDKVLELGANIGRNTCIIAQILNDDKNLVTLECNPQHVKELIENKELNGFNFVVEPSALSKKNLIQQGWDTFVSDIVFPGFFKVNTISWYELNEKYNIKFNTLVADCEGALYYILQDEPEMLSDFNKVIMENDYKDINHYNFVMENLKQHGFKNVYSQKGGWGVCENYFFQVWLK
jgi:FkbM family methyltransferase